MESQLSKSGNQTALVTGGAVRIGAAICETLAKAGWNVIIHVHQSIAQGETLCGRLRTYGVQAGVVMVDMSLPEGAATLFEKACQAAGEVDALVNNAARFSLRKELSDNERERLFRVNSEQPVALIHHLMRHLSARRASGSVVNLLDQRIVRVSREEATPYELSKILLAEATVAEARACAPFLRVNAVAPGAVVSPAEKGNKEPAGPFLLEHRPTPSDVAESVRWLLEAEAVTGQTLYVDSGQHLM
jgi:NAD(P)-dependent dehydrogenase (short-subunit alcohol dehydrogenase family)